MEGTTRLDRASGLLGFALGGFFDGILLHQILQWHHLLSGLDGGRSADLRFQILADGLFHALMYAIATAGLWLLWRGRASLAAPGASRRLVAGLLIGFGLWHVLDAVLSHWLLAIHRIRMDSAVPLAWDLAWLVLFGIVPLAVGLRASRGKPGGTARGPVIASLLAILVLAAGGAALFPPAGASSRVVAWFGPGATPQQVFAAAGAVDARVLWSDRSGELWAFDLPAGAAGTALYRHGALFVSGTFLPVGCLTWSRAGQTRRPERFMAGA